MATSDLRLDESALTGESVPVAKDPVPVGEAGLADRRNMAYSGTFATAGQGTGVVVAVGGQTELGLIHRLVGQTSGVQTPLTRKIARFSQVVTVVILALAALTFLIGVLRGRPAVEMLTAAVALAVGAIPEGLPAVVTITLALGVARMVRRNAITALTEDLGEQGLRVLALARAEHITRLEADLPELTFLGLQAMHDPPRQAAADAVRACLTAGIQVKMITGDHASTARAIGERIGLGGPEQVQVMTGAELAATGVADLPAAAERTDVFARVSPEQKLRLVKALQSRAHVVAMTGDGVNDAPALKQADIGVAMGRSDTEVAKESADMILTDDDFASIEAAVEEGRGVFDNLVKFIVWALPANVGLGLLLVAAIITGGDLPILPVQVLWLNMTAVLVLGLPFAVEPRDADIMRRPPRDPSLPLMTRAGVAQILLVSAILLAGAYGLFAYEQRIASDEVARTVVVNVFALTLLTYMFNCLSLDRPLLLKGVRRNPWVAVGALALIVIQLGYTYVPVMHEVFGSTGLGLAAWLRVTAVALVAYALVELFKATRRA